jgi:hypothetical protein
MRPTLRTQRLVALCIAGVVMLNFPLLTLWDADTTLFGLPLMPTALFVGWAALIGCAAWIVHIKRKGEIEDRDDDDDGTPIEDG